MDHERRLVAYIKRLASAGFAPDQNLVRFLALQFAEKLNISHKFKENIDIEESKNKPLKKTNENSDDYCTECLEDYMCTSSRADWIRCPDCLKWLYETYTMSNQPLCNMCGREKKRIEVGSSSASLPRS